MKIRIKFSKQGPMKFIGHLDIMRYFQKAMRRANVDIKYSEGYSPHQIMSFAAPLGVGLTSNGEYLDIEVLSSLDSKTMIRRLNEVMADGVEILNYRKLMDTEKNAMSMVAAADYTVSFRPPCAPQDMGSFRRDFLKFFENPSIVITKKTKKGERTLDIRPLIYDVRMDQEVIFLKLSTGSIENLKPETVMEVFCREKGYPFSEYTFQVERQEVYGSLEGDEASRQGPLAFKPLAAYGEEIE